MLRRSIGGPVPVFADASFSGTARIAVSWSSRSFGCARGLFGRAPRARTVNVRDRHLPRSVTSRAVPYTTTER